MEAILEHVPSRSVVFKALATLWLSTGRPSDAKANICSYRVSFPLSDDSIEQRVPSRCTGMPGSVLSSRLDGPMPW